DDVLLHARLVIITAFGMKVIGLTAMSDLGQQFRAALDIVLVIDAYLPSVLGQDEETGIGLRFAVRAQDGRGVVHDTCSRSCGFVKNQPTEHLTVKYAMANFQGRGHVDDSF